MKLYGIWCKDANEGKGDWLREGDTHGSYYSLRPILAYTSIKAARQRAAHVYGYDAYAEVKKKDWAVVLPLRTDGELYQ
jgi:hypothetical protein